MSTVQRLRNVLVNILVFLFVFILPISVLLPLNSVNGVGFMELRDIWFTFQYSSLPYPPQLSSASIVLGAGHFKVPTCIALLILTLSAFLYIRNVHGRRVSQSSFAMNIHPLSTNHAANAKRLCLYFKVYTRLLPVIQRLYRPSSPITPPTTQRSPRQRSSEGYRGRPEGYRGRQAGASDEQIPSRNGSRSVPEVCRT